MEMEEELGGCCVRLRMSEEYKMWRFALIWGIMVIMRVEGGV